VPIIGKDIRRNSWPIQEPPHPAVHLHRTDQVRFVVDTTPEFRIQMLREDIRWLDAVVFTIRTPTTSWSGRLPPVLRLRNGRCRFTRTRKRWRTQTGYIYAFDGRRLGRVIFTLNRT